MDRQRQNDIIANLLLHHLSINPSNSTSDYSYVLNLIPANNISAQICNVLSPSDTQPLPKYIFVDRVGWLPGEEVTRYLMMGYRVWDRKGRRLHFNMTTWNYDCLKTPFREQAKMVGCQDARWKPDLFVQMEAGAFASRVEGETSIACDELEAARVKTMPWDITMSDISQDEGSLQNDLPAGDNLYRAMMAWKSSRFNNARSCYTPLPCLDFEVHGGERLAQPLGLLRPMSDEKEMPCGPYPKIGVDVEYLRIQYPATNAKLRVDGVLEENRKICSICAKINLKELFELEISDIEHDLGTISELSARSNDCSFCHLLNIICQDGLKCLKRRKFSEQLDGLDSGDFDFRMLIEVLIVRNPILCLSTKPFLVLKQDYHREYVGPLVSLRTVRGDIRGEFKMESSKFVDFKLLLKMVQSCIKEHGECRLVEFEADKTNKDMILIDVLEMCLIQPQSIPEYIALSYVWGIRPMLKTTKSNIQELLQPGSLNSADIPSLAKDAIAVAKGLGQRYLWIDALCIIQDDENHKSSQIQGMADIYSQSYLTIIALNSENADSRLSGVSTPRENLITVIDGMPITAHLPGLKVNSTGRVYEQRAWTFQERLLSKRCLYFSDNQVYLECQTGSMIDHDLVFPVQDRRRRNQKGFNPLQELTLLRKHEKVSGRGSIVLKELEVFTNLISEYTSRKLTFQSDIQNAFLGIQEYLIQQEILGWSFVTGLPLEVFDWALLWLPRGQLKRRSWVTDGMNVSPPSWSWLGWQGRNSYAAYTYHSLPLLQNMQPKVGGFVIRCGGERVKVRRRISEIWHEDFGALIAPQVSEDPRVIGGIFDFSKPLVLEFEAFSTPALASSLSLSSKIFPNKVQEFDFPLSIEWLNTGPAYGMLHHGLRHGYNDSVLGLVRKYQEDGKEIDLLLMVFADVKQTFRGGQHDEEKLFEIKERAVVMCIVWGKAERVGERVAIGYCDPADWEKTCPTRKRINLR